MNLRRIGRYFHLRFLRMRSEPSEISRGLAIGVFFGMTPLLGLHMVLAVALAMFLKGNKLMALVGAWVGNPLTMPVFFVLEYKLGRWIMGASQAPVPQLSLRFGEVLQGSWNIVAPLFLGSLILGMAAALLTYVVAKPLVWTLQYRFKRRRSPS